MNSGVLILDTTTKMEMMMDFFNFGMMCKYISRVSNTICFQYFRFFKKKNSFGQLLTPQYEIPIFIFKNALHDHFSLHMMMYFENCNKSINR